MQLKDPSLLRGSCFIGGQWAEADAKTSFPVVNKTTGAEICRVPDCGAAETGRAIQAASAAFPAWAAKTAKERGAVHVPKRRPSWSDSTGTSAHIREHTRH